MIKYFNSLSIHVTQLSRTEKSNIGIHRKCKFLTAVRYSCKSQIGQCKQGAALTYSSTIQMPVGHLHTRTGIPRLYLKKFHSRTSSKTIRFQKFF